MGSMAGDPEAAGPADVLAPRITQFLAVARCENVSEAAAILGIGQPTLSRSIVRLEADLGLALFTHGGRRLRLTPAGRALAERLEPLVRRMNAEVGELAGPADPEHGRVRIGFLKSLGDEVMPTMIGGFRARHPLIEFALLKEGSNGDLCAALRAGDIDLALLAPGPDEPGIDGQWLDTQRLHLEVPAGHPLAVRGTVRLRDLADETFVTLTGDYGIRQILDTACAATGFRPKIGFQADDIRTLRALVAAGAGIALLPPAAQAHPGTAAVASSPAATRELYLAWSTATYLTPPARTFQAFMIAQQGHVFP
jgi:DNA-binding transcriptional LysR family regulator